MARIQSLTEAVAENVRDGDTVADVFAGGGYYSEILAGIVGPEGQVLLANNTGYDAFGKKGWTARLANDRLPNVKHVAGPTEAMGLGENTLDGAVIVMGYHDLRHSKQIREIVDSFRK